MAKRQKSAELIRTMTHTQTHTAWILSGKKERTASISYRASDTCHVIATGAPWCDDSRAASHSAAETGLWAYEHIRLRNTYRENTRGFVYRLVKTANLQLVKQQDHGKFPGGLFSGFICLFYGDALAWITAVGSVRAYHINAEGKVQIFATSISDAVLGVTRKIPEYTFGKTAFERDETIVVTGGYDLSRYDDTFLLPLSRTQPSDDRELFELGQECVRTGLPEGTDTGILIIRRIDKHVPTLEIM